MDMGWLSIALCLIFIVVTLCILWGYVTSKKKDLKPLTEAAEKSTRYHPRKSRRKIVSTASPSKDAPLTNSSKGTGGVEFDGARARVDQQHEISKQVSEEGRQIQCKPQESDERGTISLPSTIDPQLAVTAFRRQRVLLLNLFRHSLTPLANSLLASNVISQHVYEEACNRNRSGSERGVALLDGIEARIQIAPADFATVVYILQSEPFFQSLSDKLVHCYCAVSSATPSVNISATSSTILGYRTYLQSVYKNSPMSPDTKWPPTPSREYIHLAAVKSGSCREDYMQDTLQGNIKQVLQNRREVSMEQILEPDEGQNRLQLVLIEGAPGIGKSTLAWELCRKWEEFSSMKQYSLVVLLRLREEEVQLIAKVSDLFCYYESAEEKRSLVEELLKIQGSGILFMLDGFDELPKTLQKKSFLLNLIRGNVFPASTVLVTTRPSATAELLTCCRPRVQKRIEVLGFTQESIQAYASSIFSSEPEMLKKFKAYISVSNNPAINSLMYVPLNAAIIVEIFRSYKSDGFLPHTITELYIQLCLTYLTRYLQCNYPSVMIERIEDLPQDLFKQFLLLSKVAFEGVQNGEVIFHTVPPNLVHFGFLDAVSALFGGGRVSYNFLHLTLQEFLAAYHISQLREGGLEVLQQYGKDQRWSVVWRFVAGLTKFQFYRDNIDDAIFHIDFNGLTWLSLQFILCLFEAQTVKNFESVIAAGLRVSTPSNFLDAYVLGYCISSIPTELPWIITLVSSTREDFYPSFSSGLRTKTPSVGVIAELNFSGGSADLAEIKSWPVQGLITLGLSSCGLTNVHMTHLSELIPHVACLKTLSLSNNRPWDGEDGFVKVLEQLPLSSVASLDVINTGLTSLLRNSSHDYYSALKNAIDPSSGRLEKLYVGDNRHSDDKILGLLSSPSSLKVLSLLSWKFSLCEFKDNTCLTKLSVEFLENWENVMAHIIQILECNKTLQELLLYNFRLTRDATSVSTIVTALHTTNETLKSVTLGIGLKANVVRDFKTSSTLFNKAEIADYIAINYKEFTLDARIVWEHRTIFAY